MAPFGRELAESAHSAETETDRLSDEVEGKTLPQLSKSVSSIALVSLEGEVDVNGCVSHHSPEKGLDKRGRRRRQA